jgi:hypothetical protein
MALRVSWDAHGRHAPGVACPRGPAVLTKENEPLLSINQPSSNYLITDRQVYDLLARHSSQRSRMQIV